MSPYLYACDLYAGACPHGQTARSERGKVLSRIGATYRSRPTCARGQARVRGSAAFGGPPRWGGSAAFGLVSARPAPALVRDARSGSCLAAWSGIGLGE